MLVDTQLDGNKEELLEDTLEELIEETGKWTKQEAIYVEVPEIEHDCQKCCFYQNGSCELVEGTISPEGHCRFWVQPCPEDDSIEEYSLSQSIADLEADDDFYYILTLMQDDKLPNYKFDTLLENLLVDLTQEKQELSNSKVQSKSTEKVKLSPTKPKTLEGLRRKALMLSKMYGLKDIPSLKKPDGKPTRYSLQAYLLGEAIPKNKADVRRLAAKGEVLLKQYNNLKSQKSKQKLSQSDLPKLPLEELPIKLSNGLVKIPIAKKGSWFHDVHGVVSFSDDDFRQIKEQSSKDILGFTPYITYGHPVDLPYESVDAELKKGDLRGWEEEEDVLFGLFEAKEDVLKLVQNKDYEYSSGEFLRNYRDKFTGENKGTVLMRVALTNSPFIPFGDSKVELLSQQADSQNCLPNSIPFVIKLSADIENVNPPITEEILPDFNMTVEKTPEQLAEEVVSQLTPESVAQVADKLPEVETPVVSEPAKEEPPISASVSNIDLNKLVETITNTVTQASKVQMDALKAQYESIVSELKSQVETLNTKLTSQEQVAQAFSTTLVNQQKAQEVRELAANGVPAVLIQKFSQIQSALETKQSVIKLSTKAADGQVVEQQVALGQAIKDLLVSAVNAEPVYLHQLGQTASRIPTNTLAASIQEQVEINKAKAAKQSL